MPRLDPPSAAEDLCRHWQSMPRCDESCSCGHACRDHHDAGWCDRCSCLVWQDGPEAFLGPRSTASDDGWRLEDVFDESEERLDEAAGF